MTTAAATLEAPPVRPAPLRRLVQLDVLRGVAILLVMGHHQVTADHFGYAGPFARAWAAVGWCGVDLFFVLSGFLVGGLLLAEVRQRGRFDGRRFLIRRAFKIWPSYYVYLGYLFALRVVKQPAAVTATLGGLWPNLANVQNYAWSGDVLDGLPHTWSLAVEEQFYLLLTAAFWVLCRRPGRLERWFPYLGAGVLAGCLAARWLTGPVAADGSLMRWAERHQYPSHLRMDGLFVGVWLAFAVHRRAAWVGRLGRPGVAGATLLGGLALVAVAVVPSRFDRFSYTVGYTLLSVGFAAVLAATALGPADGPWARRAWASPLARGVAFVGTYSYSIYLWHVVLGYRVPLLIVHHGVLSGYPTTQWLVIMAAYVTGAVVAGIVIARLVEFPALALRNRLFPSRSEPISLVRHTADPGRSIPAEM